jgi:excisionase family DNA binding protein
MNEEKIYMDRITTSGNIKDLPTVLSVAEACQQLRVSKWTLYKLMHSHQLESIRIRRRRLIPLTAIQDLVSRLSDEGIT